MADNVTDIGALTEQRINDFNELIFVGKDSLLGLRVAAATGFPELDASGKAAGAAAFVVHAA